MYVAITPFPGSLEINVIRDECIVHRALRKGSGRVNHSESAGEARGNGGIAAAVDADGAVLGSSAVGDLDYVIRNELGLEAVKG